MGKVIKYAGAPLYPKQRAAVFDPCRISVIEASVKSGKTIGCLAWLFEQAALNGRPGRNWWWVAPVFSQAEIAFRRMRLAIPRSLYKDNQSKLTITLVNGATLWFKSGERCYDSDTEVLTDKGWRLFRDLDRTERVLTLDLDSQTAEWQRPTDYLDEAYEGPMRRFRSEKVDLLVTPGHRFPVVHPNGTTSLLTLDKIGLHDVIPRRVAWVGEDDPTISEDACALLGIFLAEGSAAGCSGGKTALRNGDYTIHFTQSPGNKGSDKGNVRGQLIALLRRMGYDPKETREGVFVRNERLWKNLIGLGNRYEKAIPARYKELPPAKLRVILHWLVLGDGVRRKGRIGAYYTVSKRLADDVQEIAVKAGLSATVTSREPGPGGVNAKGRRIVGTAPLYTVTFTFGKNDYIQSSSRKYVSDEDYSGRIYCVTVPNHTLLVRRHGRIAWSGNSDDLYGEDVYAAVVDEASRMREDSWLALRSTLTATQGPARLIGNVKGRKNWFYDLARAAETGTPDMAFHRITCWDAVEAGVLDREEIEASRRDYERLGRLDAWRQSYEAVAADDGSNPFGLAAIEACIVPGLSREYPLAAGVDLAGRGASNVSASSEVLDRDYTAIVMLDRDGCATYIDRFRKPHTETEHEIVRAVGRTMALVDSTGTGDAIVERLQRRGDMRVEGFTFTQRSRQDLLEGLALAIGEEAVHFPDGPVRSELESFEFDYRPSGFRWAVPQGQHDDLVFALALAVRKLPWRRRALQVPVGIPSQDGSRWAEGSQETDAWRKYQDGKKPTQSGLADESRLGRPDEPVVGLPIVTRGPTSGRWGGADR